MNENTTGLTRINQVRAQRDREYVADVLLTIARRRIKYIRSAPASDREDTVTIVVMSLMKDWDKGVPLSDLVKWVGARLVFRGIEAGRSADRRPLSILDSPLKDDAAITYGETLEDHKATVEARILAKERITELKPMIDELNEYLATQPPRVALIHQMACSGIARNEISTILADKHGIEASPDLVAQIITRNLRKRFPHLAFLWEKKSKQSS